MKILLRNLVNLFARNKTAALLNIAGLTVAFASFMLIMMQVWYELGYDRCYPNANRIYGLCFQVPQSGDLGTVLPRPLAEKLLRSSAGIETGGCLSYQHGDPNVPFFRPERGPESAIAAGFSLVSRSWLDVFGFETLSGDLNAFSEMHLVEGRDFTETDQQRDAPALIFNRTAKKLYDITVPDWLEHSGEIVGIVEDYHDKPLHYSIEPIALIVYDRSSPLYCMYVKINNPDPGPAIAFIREAYRTLSPQRQVPDVKFMEEQLGNLYQKERNLSEMIFLFSLVSVSLAITGVFGVIHFETSSRRKEIALRKVYGSQTGEILRMFNKTYIRIVLICFAVAAPAAYIVVKRWLESFTYKTPIPSWIFLMAPAIVLIIVVAVITLRCYKTATDNPIKSIRTE